MLLCLGVVLVAIGLSFMLSGTTLALGGAFFGGLITIGVLALVGFVLLLVFSGIGLLVVGILGLVGVILLAIALPFLAPILIVLVPIAIIAKLAGRHK